LNIDDSKKMSSNQHVPYDVIELAGYNISLHELEFNQNYH